MIESARSFLQRRLGSGRARIESIRQGRERSRLFAELGEARYAQSKGVATSEAEIERLIGELDALEASTAETETSDGPDASTSETDAS